MERIIYGSNWWMGTLNLRLMVAAGKLPDLKRTMEKLPTSGSWFNLSLPYELEELQAEFDLNGPDERIRSRFGREPGDWTTLYYYERIRDCKAGKNIGRAVALKGLINDITPQRTRQLRGEDTSKVMMSSIVLYHDQQDGRTVHKFDFFNNQLVIDGIDYSAEHNQIIAA
jgi:P2 family phage contractile tail tube protein